MSSSLMKITAIASWILLTIQGAEAQKWPSLRFHFIVKRQSMQVHNQQDFSIYANPILHNSNSVLYDAFATFTEDSTLYNYTLINGIAHSTRTPYSSSQSGETTTTVSCFDAESSKLPGVNSFVSAINDASASSSDKIACDNGKMYKVMLKGIDFALCSSESGFKMFGTDMDIDVEFLESPIDIVVPTEKVKLECGKVATASPITTIGKALLTGKSLNKARNLKAEMSFSFRSKSTCSCQSTPRPCVFIHGLGVKDEFPENQDQFTDYWGTHLAGHGPCCSSMKFAHLDTVNSTWTDEQLQEKVCNRALTASNSSRNAVISDTIVVTHSMGNVMFAGALSTGKCSLDSSSTWIGMAGPMFGSMCSDFVQDSCAGKTNIVWEKIGNITGRCPPNTGLKSLAYEGGSYSSGALNAAYKAAQEVYRTSVSALMCGRSYSGLPSKYQAQFWGLGAMVPHKSKQNDGMVEFQSCAAGIPESKFGANYRDRFYKTKLNHYDMQFRAGDSLLDEEKMPLKWFDCLL
ncbi:hypothetical protein P3T76_015404 [Phytophthora citrophthora]|uniref:Uncharacterized protein n=1 Tax=Phytophthora citrophthora TaxID=4793 RepID=A0AAD9FZP5_9STRA|nr:hypothetical protein P3T76_015404 [Phytophthora citrophthora]